MYRQTFCRHLKWKYQEAKSFIDLILLLKIPFMNKYFFFFVLLIAAGFQHITAQYYHKDIVSVQQATAEKNSWQQQKIRNILVHSFEANGSASEGFYGEKKISKDYRTIETYTRSAGTGKSLLTSYYNEKGLLVKSNDSAEAIAATSLYEYDAKDNIIRITSYTHSSDDDFATSLKEVHQYTWNDKGNPVNMLRIKNDKDTAQINFVTDAKGNVTDETEPGANGRHYYYYYDDKNRLTDIVKYNAVKGGLRPDFAFEYNSEGQITRMITVEEGVSADYYTWEYIYNDGLKIIEKCFAKSKTLLGYFEYEYQ